MARRRKFYFKKPQLLLIGFVIFLIVLGLTVYIVQQNQAAKDSQAADGQINPVDPCPDGYVIVFKDGIKQCRKYTVEEEWGDPIPYQPGYIVAGPSGSVYVHQRQVGINDRRHGIWKYPPEGGAGSQFVIFPDSDVNFSFYGMVVDSKENIYVFANIGSGVNDRATIIKVGGGQSFVVQNAPYYFPLYFLGPVVDYEDNVYFTARDTFDKSKARLYKITSTGEVVNGHEYLVGPGGDGFYDNNFPSGVAVDRASSKVYTIRYNGQVNPNVAIIDKFLEDGVFAGSIEVPLHSYATLFKWDTTDKLYFTSNHDLDRAKIYQVEFDNPTPADFINFPINFPQHGVRNFETWGYGYGMSAYNDGDFYFAHQNNGQIKRVSGLVDQNEKAWYVKFFSELTGYYFDGGIASYSHNMAMHSVNPAAPVKNIFIVKKQISSTFPISVTKISLLSEFKPLVEPSPSPSQSPSVCQMGYTVKVVQGNAGAAGTFGNKINLDAIIENGVVRESNTAGFTAAPIGDWYSSQNPAMSGGSDMRSSKIGDSITFTTTAKDLNLVYSRGIGHMIAQVSVDGTKVLSIDQYNNGNLYQQKKAIPMPAQGKTQLCDASAFTPKNLMMQDPAQVQRPELMWDAVPGVTTYKVEVSVSDGVVWQTVSGTILKKIPGDPEKIVWMPSADFRPSKLQSLSTTPYTKLKVRVFAVHPQYGVSAPSNEFASYIPMAPPAQTTAQVVASGQVNIAPYLLRWTRVPSTGLQQPIKAYHIQIATDQKFETIVSDVKNYVPQTVYQTNTTVSYPVPANSLKPATTYYWRMRAQSTDGSGAGQDGKPPAIASYPVFSNWLTGPSFKSKLGVAELVSPVNNTIAATLKPTFRWKEVSQATTYTFQTAPVVAGKVPVWTTRAGTQTKAGGEVSFVPNSNLPANTEMLWKVIASNATYGTSDSSTTYQFRFKTP